jgi:hypothetical protein
MNRIALISGAFVLSLPLMAVAGEQHTVVTPDQLKWQVPAHLQKGAEATVVSGDPSKEGPYVTRLKVPAGFKIMPHTHPNTENVTVISGQFHIGSGEKFDESKLKALQAGSYSRVPQGMPHYAMASEDTVIQLHGMGPQGIVYVNPADDPRKSN